MTSDGRPVVGRVCFGLSGSGLNSCFLQTFFTSDHALLKLVWCHHTPEGMVILRV